MTASIPPLQQQALESAAQWYARLCSGEAGDCDEKALQDWLQQDPLNRWAWGRVDQLQNNMARIRGNAPGGLAMDTLEWADRNFSSGRRTLLKGFAGVVVAGSLGWTGYRLGPAPDWLADQHTATGEIRRMTLADGSVLVLNTATGIDIAFTANERRLRLRRGEILVETARDARPFIVETANGQVRALGTRFTVRELAGHTRVTVYEHRVEITSRAGRQQVFAAGEVADFGRDDITAVATSANSDAWVRRILVVENMPLDAFAAELSRYRPGLLHCDPSVANYRISGAFKLDDTDQALQAIAKSFPVQVTYRTRYWVSIQPL